MTVMKIIFSLIIAFSLTCETKVATDWTYNVTTYNGNVSTFIFPKMAAAECLYSQPEDRLFCMRNYDYTLIVPEWKYRAEDIHYVRVNCKKQNFFFHHKRVCICKTGSQAADPTRNRQYDVYGFCQIEHVDSDLFGKLSKLKLLDISSNRIITIDRESFVGLDMLQFLSLSDNPFDYLPDRLLCSLPQIRFVLMRQTQLEKFPSNIFFCGQTNHSVEHLDISEGALRNIGPYSLEHLPALISLNLSYNLLKRMDENSFYGGNSLRYLDLTGNQLKQYIGICNHLARLEQLLIRENNLVTFNFSSLADCSILKRLDLAFNSIVHLQGHLSHIQTLEDLVLSDNRLQKLGFQETFGNSTSLQRLTISFNGLTTLHRDLLIGLENLVFLNLSGNSLQEDSVEFDRILAHPQKLKVLDLSFNQMTSLENETFIKLVHLELLDLSFNRLGMLKKSSFKGLNNLRSLKIRFNIISFIELGTFDHLTRLDSLDLSNNQLRSVGTLPESLRSLVLDDNLLTALPGDMNLPIMTYLSVRKNSIKEVKSGVFINASDLKELDISENQLTGIESGTFLGLDKLSNLNLRHNDLVLNLSADIFAGANNIQKLTLSENRISFIDGLMTFSSMWNLQEINISLNPLSQIGKLTDSSNSSKLVDLDVSGCLIDSISTKAFENLDKLKNVYLQNNNLQSIPPMYGAFGTRYYLSGNPVICSCDMKWLKAQYVTVNGRKIPTSNYIIDTCVVYPKMFKLPLLNTPKSMFLCKQLRNCDDSCKCYSQEVVSSVHTVVCTSKDKLPYDISHFTKTLYLDGSNYESVGITEAITDEPNMETENVYLNHSRIVVLGRDAFVNFPELKVLNLGNNRIKKIPADIFRRQLHLEKLYLNDNYLTVIDPSVIKSLISIKLLDISGNRFQSVSIGVTSALTELLPSLMWISLGHNPWTCDCHNVFLRRWIESHYSRVFDKRSVTCGNKEMMDMLPEEYECLVSKSHMSTTKIVSISAIVAVMVLSLVVGFIVYFRRDITALMYTEFSLSCCRKKMDTDKPCDVLVVYDATNESCSMWFSGHLLPKLEKHQYKVQIADDSPQSPSVWDNQNALIEMCSCSLIVITEYIDSNEMCMKYFKSALEHKKHNPRHGIILAVFGNIDMNKLDLEMMVMLRKGNYLTVRSRVFWSRLVYELPDPCPDVATRIRTEYDNISESEVTLYCSSSNFPQTGHV